MSAPGSLRPSVSPEGPQVVIGIAPPSILPDEDDAMTAESRQDVEDPSETAPMPTTLEQRSVEQDGLVAVHHVGAMQRQVGFTVDDRAETATVEATMAAPAETADETRHETSLDEDDAPTPPPIEAAARIDSDAPPAPAGKILDPDEVSIPPIGDLHEDKFFSDGEKVVHAFVSPEEEWDLSKVKSQRKAAPEVVERRNRFTRWVRWAVAGAAVVCLAATIRTVATKPMPVAPKVSAANVVKVEAPIEAPKAEAKAEAPKAEAPKAEVAKAEESATPVKADAPKADEPKAETPKTDEPKAAPSDDDLKTAVTEKRAAQSALERGKLDDAIAAGEKSVELNPADGEAWLILGATYQQKGKLPEARKAFKACTEQGKKGPIGECRAMLRM